MPPRGCRPPISTSCACCRRASNSQRRAGNRLDYFRDNQTLHEAIVASAGNSAITEIHLRLIARVGNARYVAILSEARWSDAVREHAEILAALERRDARRAGELMREHVARTGEVVRASLDRDPAGEREAISPERAAMANAEM